MSVRTLRKPIVRMARSIMRTLAARAGSRRVLNGLYGGLSLAQKRRVHRAFGKIFRDRQGLAIDAGQWEVDFLGRRILLPLKPERFWLDWGQALSIIGHDAEVKETYAAFIESVHRPELFIDIGANYGQHSLLFLVHGIRTLTFEPNRHCRDYLSECCLLNGVTARLEAVALGDSHANVELVYPETETWLGSVDPVAQARIVSGNRMLVNRVEQRSLDDYLPLIGEARTLVKIDTEGHELAVLRGAAETLRRIRPHVIVEVLEDAGKRAELLEFLDATDYDLADLPWGPGRPLRRIGRATFLATPATNFLAAPRGG